MHSQAGKRPSTQNFAADYNKHWQDFLGETDHRKYLVFRLNL